MVNDKYRLLNFFNLFDFNFRFFGFSNETLSTHKCYISWIPLFPKSFLWGIHFDKPDAVSTKLIKSFKFNCE